MMNTDFIEIYDNSISQELCNELVNWFDLCSDKKFTVHNMPYLGGKEVPRPVFRSDESISIPAGIDISSVSSNSIPGKICDAFWEVLNTCSMEYTAKYDMGDMDFSCYNFKIHKVKEVQGYHIWHYETETVLGLHRILAWMTYLKIPEKGGETEFLYQSRRIEPVVGRTLIWPAHFTHLHRGNPPLKGEKYYITGWFERNDT